MTKPSVFYVLSKTAREFLALLFGAELDTRVIEKNEAAAEQDVKRARRLRRSSGRTG